jgi:hypothetical protein
MATDVPMNADAGGPARRGVSVVLQAVGVAGLLSLAVILRADPPGWLVVLTVVCLVAWLIWETAQKRRPERRPVNRILDAEIRYLLLGVVMLVGGVVEQNWVQARFSKTSYGTVQIDEIIISQVQAGCFPAGDFSVYGSAENTPAFPEAAEQVGRAAETLDPHGDSCGNAPKSRSWCLGNLGANMAICLDVAGWSEQADRLATEYWQPVNGGSPRPYSGYSGGGPPDGSAGNAFKHMFWSGMIAHHYGKSIAKQLTDAHETEGSFDASVATRMHRQMDFANNFYGRELAGQGFSGVIEISLALRERVAAFVDAGHACTRAPGNPNTPQYDGPFVRESRCGFT